MTMKRHCRGTHFLRWARDCDGVIVAGGERIDAEFFNAARKLKVVSCVAVGYDNIDLAEAPAAASMSPKHQMCSRTQLRT